jgi:hypothetical protein
MVRVQRSTVCLQFYSECPNRFERQELYFGTFEQIFEKIVCELVESKKVVLIVAMEFISAVPPTVHFIFNIGAVRLNGGWMRVQELGTILRDYLNDGIQLQK